MKGRHSMANGMVFLACAALALSYGASAQAPVENGPRVTDSMLGAQQKAGHAHDVWQQAAGERERAERDFHAALDNYTAAQKAQNEAKSAMLRSKQAFETARTRELRAQAAYDTALKTVSKRQSAVRKK